MRAEEVARVRTLDIEAPGWRLTARAHTFDCRDNTHTSDAYRLASTALSRPARLT